MSVLTDTDLMRILSKDQEWANKNTLNIYPFSEGCLTPVGYDFRVGGYYLSVVKGDAGELGEGDVIRIAPGDVVLIHTLESLRMPMSKTLSGFIVSKVSLVSKGLSHISTSIDPDYQGPLLIAIHNPSKKAVSIKHKEMLCTAVFLENKSPSTKPCDKEPGRDALIKNFIKVIKKIKYKWQGSRIVQIMGYLLLIGLFGYYGYFKFGNEPGFIAMVALGGSLTSIIHSMSTK